MGLPKPETPMKLNDPMRLLRKLREHIVNELTGKIDNVSRETGEYFQSLGKVLTKRFDGVDRRFDGIDNRLDGVESYTKEMKETLSRIEAKLDDRS